jgi:gliding motility-associated-like protein
VKINNDSLILGGNDILCPNDNIQLSVTDTAKLDLRYSWTPTADILSGSNTATPIAKPARNTTFYVTATTPAGCIYKDSIEVKVISTLQNIQATATPDSIRYGDTSKLKVIYTAATSIVWDLDPSLSSTTVDSPLAYPKTPTLYWVTVTDQNGCRVRDSVRVYLKYTSCESSNIFVPNAFSPNNDGKNDKLFVRGNFIKELYFAVYDRWGQRVFETRDMNTGWDGTYKGTKMDPAVFGWYVEGVCDGGEKFFRKGNVTLLR